MLPLIVIPARYASTRLPGKPLADLGGKPMVVRVWEKAVASELGRVVVATDDARIIAAVEAEGGEAVMTCDHHPSGSDRVWEALRAIDPLARHDVIINVQGDVPTLPPALIAATLAPLEADASYDLATLAALLSNPAEAANPAIVKPAIAWETERLGTALYFSRNAIPWGEGPHYHHIGLYAWRREALDRFVHLTPSPLEKREKLEQLRALENGMKIGVALVDEEPPGVDTPDQLEAIRKEFAP